MTLVAGRTALVTGGAGAIGQGIAAALAAAGAQVVLADRDEQALDRAADIFARQGMRMLTAALDVTSASQWARAVETAERQLGPVQLLFNNAGVSALGVRIEDMDGEYWQRVMAINVTSIILGVQAVVPRLRALGLDGHIVNTSSIAGLGVTMPGAGAYAASKMAVTALSEALEPELKDSGIGVSLLCPGPVRSELWRTSRGALGLPGLDAPPEDSRKGSASPDAMDPADVGRMTVKAVLENRFYVVTHPGAMTPLDVRHARLRADTVSG